jgi:hypothetical protein
MRGSLLQKAIARRDTSRELFTKTQVVGEHAGGVAGYVSGRSPWGLEGGFIMRMAFLTISLALGGIASWAWCGVSLFEKGWVEKNRTPGPSEVERTNKSDRVVRAFNVRNTVPPPFSVEIVGSHNTAVTIRDHDGSILYRVSPAERVTVIAKRPMQKPVAAPERLTAPTEMGSSDAARELPDGCESAFSPYVEPSMANVIGRCVS